MATQTLMFVALPNGRAAGNKLRISLYLAPRLDQGATLAAFPDVLSWTQRVHDKGLTFKLACGANTATVKSDASVLRPDLWKTIFTSTTYVEAYKIPPLKDQLIVSYPVRRAHDYLKYIYQVAGGTSDEKELLERLLEPLSFRDQVGSTLDAEMAQMRVTIWGEQHGAAGVPLAPPPPPPSDPLDNAHDMATRFELYHHLPPAPGRPPLPSTEADFAKTLDFHRALTALQSYPSLLRQLGLVFDVEVPDSFCPASPAAGSYGSIAVSQVTAGFTWSITPTFAFPPTSYVISPKVFVAAPAASPSDAAAGNYAAGDVVNGWLALAEDGFSLVQVDLDGALLKALGLADTVAFGRADLSTMGDELSALRSAGIGLAADGRALALLSALRDNQSFDDALNAGGQWPRAFTARDLVRGYRLDVFSSITGKWHSLHRRDSTYVIGAAKIKVEKADEEGFNQLAATQPADDPTRPVDAVAQANNIPQPGTDIYIHERVASWQGWSLSAPRPGGTLNRSPDPAKALDDDPTTNAPMTPFKMTTSFAAHPGSLPALRFGARYRLRVRTVDIAGNSVSYTAAPQEPFVLPPGGATTPYLRFEPVNPPIVVLRSPPQSGGHLLRLVIRSRNTSASLDGVRTTDTDDRHIAPPLTSQRMAEQHGMFDAPNGKLQGDAATYQLMVQRDEYQIPTDAALGVPLVSSPQLDVGYLPDPFATGAALRALPGTAADTYGRISGGALAYATLPDVQPNEDSVTFIDFGSAWPGRLAFRLVIAEGSAAPEWDAGGRVLTVSLPKAHVNEVSLSSYLTAGALAQMGVWGWLREAFEEQQLLALQDGGVVLNFEADVTALVTRLALEGGHEMLTPSTKLTLVHATQQPIGAPSFIQLPVVHRPTEPIFASALRNLFTPITAWRAHGSHDATLLGGLKVHGKSTVKIDLNASWIDLVDDPKAAAPARKKVSSHVETIDLSSLDARQIPADGSGARSVAVYVPQVDTLWFAANFDELAGVETPGGNAAPVHHFADTLHRWVRYVAVATSRFEEYFEPGLDFTRTGDALMVDVPSSARPATPKVLYVVPTFGWERQETTTLKSSVRFGYGLRVYLDRPWYSSGDNELLGVLLWPESTPAPDYPTREKYKAFFTQWGNDPIWASGNLEAVPLWGDFQGTAQVGAALTLAETDQVFDVAGYEVHFDPDRKLWYCDVTLFNQTVYSPFIRLALARYQPHSIEGVELSHAVLADYAQLAPNRSALVTIDPADPRSARVIVGGTAGDGPQPNVITVTVEQADPKIGGDLGWAPAAASVVAVTPDAPAPSQPDSVLWSGVIAFAKTPASGAFRVVIREFESLVGDTATGTQRLVYAAIIGYDFPSLSVK